MPRQQKTPNQQLEELLVDSGLSAKGLARRVVERAAQLGLKLAYDHNSVRRWLTGEQPLQPTPTLVAEVLSETLGRPISPAECGFNVNGSDLGLSYPLVWQDGINAATALFRSDTERRRTLVGSVFSIAAYPAAAIRWLTSPDEVAPAHRGRARVGQPEIDAIRQMTAAFRDLDNRVGGTRIRSTVVQYLHANVAPLLSGSYTHDVGCELFSAAAELTKNVGWMAYDAEEHGIAQRYLIQALRMAKTATDHGLCAEILAAMGHQATYIRRDADAVDLARAAQVAARRAGLATLTAECHLIEAHGHAGLGDHRRCSRALSAGERAFDQSDAISPPEWLSYFDEAYFSAKIAHCFRALEDDMRTAHFAVRSLEMNPNYVRGKMFNLALLAGAHAAHEPAEAARIGAEAATLVEGLESTRARSYLRDLVQRLARHVQVPEVARFIDHARKLSAR